jgi:hypothetical protein
VGAQKIKSLKTPSKSTQPPAKITQNQQQINGSQSKSGFVPKIYQKNEKKLKNLEKWVFGFLWGKMGNGGQWWPAVGDNGRREACGGTGVVGL